MGQHSNTAKAANRGLAGWPGQRSFHFSVLDNRNVLIILNIITPITEIGRAFRGRFITAFTQFPQSLDAQRIALASSSAALALAALGLLCGVLTGVVIVLFRGAMEIAQMAFMPEANIENFEALSAPLRFCLPVAGGLILGLSFHFLSEGTRQVGIMHVMQRMQYHEGHLPLRNLVVQFFSAAVALMSGHSVGREAPSVHLGAAASSLLGQRLRLPNNTIRILVACGVAAAIAASFNTPLAGVIFAMEVVLMEYTIAGFTPVILAAVGATVVTRAVFGADAIFMVPPIGLTSLWTLCYIVVMGVCIGAFSAIFVMAVRSVSRKTNGWPILWRMIAAGVAVGLIGWMVPAVLGMGYDSVDLALSGRIAASSLVIILLAKIVATAICIGNRVPGGLIGPTIMMGAMIGGIFAYCTNYLPNFNSDPGLFVVLGMGAMMGAVLQAPLAALLALLELTANPHLIMPAMLAIVSATLTAKELFRQDSVYSLMMRDAGLDYRSDPLSQSLRRSGVAGAMSRQFVESAPEITSAQARALLADTPLWIIVVRVSGKRSLLPASDLARFLEENEVESDIQQEAEYIDLMEIPSHRRALKPIQLQATLQEAREILLSEGIEALYVTRTIAPAVERTYGIVLAQDIEAAYAIPST